MIWNHSFSCQYPWLLFLTEQLLIRNDQYAFFNIKLLCKLMFAFYTMANSARFIKMCVRSPFSVFKQFNTPKQSKYKF